MLFVLFFAFVVTTVASFFVVVDHQLLKKLKPVRALPVLAVGVTK